MVDLAVCLAYLALGIYRRRQLCGASWNVSPRTFQHCSSSSASLVWVNDLCSLYHWLKLKALVSLGVWNYSTALVEVPQQWG